MEQPEFGHPCSYNVVVFQEAAEDEFFKVTFSHELFYFVTIKEFKKNTFMVLFLQHDLLCLAVAEGILLSTFFVKLFSVVEGIHSSMI